MTSNKTILLHFKRYTAIKQTTNKIQNVHGLQRVAVSRNKTGLLHIRDIMCALQTEVHRL